MAPGTWSEKACIPHLYCHLEKIISDKTTLSEMLGDLTMKPFSNILQRYWRKNKEFTAIIKISSLNIL